MVGVAACGYFMIASSEMNTRAFAFVFSIIFWQAHYVVMMWEADAIASSKRRAGPQAQGGALEKPG